MSVSFQATRFGLSRNGFGSVQSATRLRTVHRPEASRPIDARWVIVRERQRQLEFGHACSRSLIHRWTTEDGQPTALRLKRTAAGNSFARQSLHKLVLLKPMASQTCRGRRILSTTCPSSLHVVIGYHDRISGKIATTQPPHVLGK